MTRVVAATVLVAMVLPPQCAETTCARAGSYVSLPSPLVVVRDRASESPNQERGADAMPSNRDADAGRRWMHYPRGGIAQS
jgi:hypothetical protein